MFRVPVVPLKGPNLVQAEFFHVPLEGTMEGMLRECLDRVKDEAPIKTHVRFYDRDNVITVFAREAEALNARKDALLGRVNGTRGLRRWFLCRHYQRAARASSEAYRRLSRVAADELAKALSCREVAVEDNRCKPFRMVRGEEEHELLEAARAANRAWVFVFEHNHLLSEKNKSVATMMFPSLARPA